MKKDTKIIWRPEIPKLSWVTHGIYCSTGVARTVLPTNRQCPRKEHTEESDLGVAHRTRSWQLQPWSQNCPHRMIYFWQQAFVTMQVCEFKRTGRDRAGSAEHSPVNSEGWWRLRSPTASPARFWGKTTVSPLSGLSRKCLGSFLLPLNTNNSHITVYFQQQWASITLGL